MRKKTKNTIKTICATIAVVLVLTLGVGLVYSLTANKKYTVSTPKYKDFQQFVCWKDESGNIVSEEPTYTYKAKEEIVLTAEYSDVNVVPMVGTKNKYFATERKYYSSSWFDLAYVDLPMKKGMSISFNTVIGNELLLGFSEKNRIENSANYGWGSSFTQLFVPEHNFYYSSGEKEFKQLSSNLASTMGGKTALSTNYVFSNIERGKSYTIKFVFADKILMYVDDALLYSGWSYDSAKDYYLSLTGQAYNFVFESVGFEKDSKQKFIGNPVSANYYEGKKITLLGDSITAGVGASDQTTERYSTVLCETLGATEHNMGSSGTVVATGGERTSRLKDIANIPADSSVVVVMLGTNDFDKANANQYTLGKNGDTDTATVWGSLNELCKLLSDKFKETDTKVYLITPPIRQSNDNDWLNTAGYSLRDYSTAVMTMAEKYGLVYFDLNGSGELTAEDMADNLHPNTSGHSKIANALSRFILNNYTYYNPNN